MQRAWNKYGEESFGFNVLEKCPVEDLDSKEIMWIEKYNTVKEGYNITYGGGGTMGYIPSQETIEKIRKAHVGIKRSKEQVEKNRLAQIEWHKTHLNSRSKKIICLNTKEVFGNSKIASNKYNLNPASIRKCCHGELRHHGVVNEEKYVWRFYDDYLQLTDLDILNLIVIANSNNCGKYNSKSKKVLCLDTGETFDSIREASKTKNINENTIGACCRGKVKHAGGMRWQYCAT